MTLFEMWYLGMIAVVIIQQITIWKLVNKLDGKNRNNPRNNKKVGKGW